MTNIIQNFKLKNNHIFNQNKNIQELLRLVKEKPHLKPYILELLGESIFQENQNEAKGSSALSNSSTL